MPCGDNGAGIVQALSDFYEQRTDLPATAGQVAEAIVARLNGTTPDFSTGDMFNATHISSLPTMARAQAFNNAGRALTAATTQGIAPVDNLISTAENITSQIDSDPNGGAGADGADGEGRGHGRRG